MKTLSCLLTSWMLVISPVVLAQTTTNENSHAENSMNSGVSTQDNIRQSAIASGNSINSVAIGPNAVHQDYASVVGANRSSAKNKPWEKQSATEPQGVTDSTRNYLKNSSSP
jgi:hypothetical protein